MSGERIEAGSHTVPEAPAWSWAAVIGVLVVAFSLRTALASVPPLLPVIRHDLGLDRAVVGLLTAIPVGCMGVFAPAAVRLGQRWGGEAVIVGAVLLLGVSMLARGIDVGAGGLYGATVGAGIGMAIAGPLLSGSIKARFPRRAALVTGLYTAALSLGAAAAAGWSAPLTSALGGSWRGALAVWGIPALAGALCWPLLTGRGPAIMAAHVRLPWDSARGWIVTVVFALQSFIYYASLTWLAPLYRDRGWSAAEAGLLLSVFSVLQIAGSLAVPALAGRSHDRRPWLAGSAALTMVSLLAVALLPGGAPWLWAGALGFGAGALFPLALTLPLDYADTPAEATALAGMALGVGYIVAAFAPFLIGALRDATGAYRIPFLLVAALAAIVGVIGLFARPRHG